jgi:hypothetical protein
MQREVSPEE